MIRVEMHLWEADNGYTFEFHGHNPQGVPGIERIDRRVCVEGKGTVAIQRLEGLIGVLLTDFFELVKQDIRKSIRVESK